MTVTKYFIWSAWENEIKAMHITTISKFSGD